MAVRKAQAVWEGSLKEGKGNMRFGSGAYEGAYTYVSRFEEGPGTNPEELIGAAHAGCFSMALSGELGRAGLNPRRIETQAEVKLEPVDGKQTISIHLITKVDVPDIDDQKFQEIAEAAKNGCPVSRALAATKITLDAQRV
jgi:lipoyl-dependent peroxiredoxin